MTELEKIERQQAVERFDWFAFRCEVAKQCVPALIEYYKGMKRFPDPSGVCSMAICYADELIEKLKEIE